MVAVVVAWPGLLETVRRRQRFAWDAASGAGRVVSWWVAVVVAFVVSCVCVSVVIGPVRVIMSAWTAKDHP